MKTFNAKKFYFCIFFLDIIDRPLDTNMNMASESQNYPITIANNPNDAQYIVKNREKELRSILKKDFYHKFYSLLN